MRYLRGRLNRLERAVLPSSGRCPGCPPIALVTEDSDGNVLEGAYPKPCSICGGTHDRGIKVIVVRLPPAEPVDCHLHDS
jgi:hypothetical protein